jgi:hypothetical protein
LPDCPSARSRSRPAGLGRLAQGPIRSNHCRQFGNNRSLRIPEGIDGSAAHFAQPVFARIRLQVAASAAWRKSRRRVGEDLPSPPKHRSNRDRGCRQARCTAPPHEAAGLPPGDRDRRREPEIRLLTQMVRFLPRSQASGTRRRINPFAARPVAGADGIIRCLFYNSALGGTDAATG